MATEGPEINLDFERIETYNTTAISPPPRPRPVVEPPKAKVKKREEYVQEEHVQEKYVKEKKVTLESILIDDRSKFVSNNWPMDKRFVETEKKEVEQFMTFYLVFLELDKAARSHCINRWAAWYQGKWIHCEMYFPHTRESISVDKQNPVYIMKDKDYSGRKWHFYPMEVPSKQYFGLYKACLDSLDEPFDGCGLSWFFCPVGCCIDPPNPKQKWLCSRFCATKLQDVGIVNKALDAYTATPTVFRKEIFKMHKAIWERGYPGKTFKDIIAQEQIEYKTDTKAFYHKRLPQEKGQ